MVCRSRCRTAFSRSLLRYSLPDGGGKLNLFQRLTERPVFDEQFQMHFRFTLELGYALQEGLAVQPNSPAQRIISIKNGTKAERQHSGAFKALADHMSVLQ